MRSTLRLAFLLVAVLGGAAFAEDPAKPAMDPKKAAELQKMMEAMQKYGALGPEHARFKAMTGSWDAAIKFWMEPGGPAQDAKGSAEFKTVLGDHFLQQDFKGDMMGQPFEGRGMIGYNNALKKYQAVWMDAMSTGFYGGDGTADKDGKVITFATVGTDPMTSKTFKGQDKWIFEGDNRFVFEMWSPPPKGGKLYKSMEITYTKK